MTGSEFVDQCWKCKPIRQYILDQAKRRSKGREDQEDFAQEAWLAVSTVPHCYGVDGCKELCYNAIYSGYWQHNKERLLQNTMQVAAPRQKVMYYDEDSGGPRQTIKDLY